DSSEKQPAASVRAEEDAGDRSTVMPHSAVSVVEVDMSRIVSAADRSDARVGQTSALTAIFVEAGLSGLRGYPALHALFRGGDGGGYRHVAVAVETDDGNVTAVVKDANDLNLGGLTRRIGDLEAHAKASSLTIDDLAPARFTVAHARRFGVILQAPVLGPGRVAVLTAGSIVERPIVVRRPDGERVVAIRSMSYVSLTYDARLVDAAVAARFLASVKERLATWRPDGAPPPDRR